MRLFHLPKVIQVFRQQNSAENISLVSEFHIILFKGPLFNQNITKYLKKWENMGHRGKKINPIRTVLEKDLMLDLSDMPLETTVFKMFKKLKEDV
jgi:hypothetical protein